MHVSVFNKLFSRSNVYYSKLNNTCSYALLLFLGACIDTFRKYNGY